MEPLPQTDPETADDAAPLAADAGVFLSVETSGDSAPTYGSRLTLVLPICQLFIGVSCILLQVWVLINEQSALYHVPPNVAPGIWCGTLYLICGTMGIAASRWRHKGFIIVFLVLSILSAVSVFIIAGVSGTALMKDKPNYDTQEGTSNMGMSQLKAAFVGNGALLSFATVEFVVAVWSSVLCSTAICSCKWGSSNPVSYKPLLAQ